jgi:hypothetical protein
MPKTNSAELILVESTPSPAPLAAPVPAFDPHPHPLRDPLFQHMHPYKPQRMNGL